MERSQDRDDRQHPAAGEIADLHAGYGGTRALFADDAEHARVSDVIGVVPRGLRTWPVLSVSADRAIDEPGVEHAQGFVTGPQPVHDPGPERLDDDVGL